MEDCLSSDLDLAFELVQRDLEHIKRGRVPPSWELSDDPDCLAFVRKLRDAPIVEHRDVADAFAALAFSTWRQHNSAYDLAEFIERVLVYASMRLKRWRQPKLFK